MHSESNTAPAVRLKKVHAEKYRRDKYCFECHRTGDVINCNSCSRAYHAKCLDLSALPEQDWICPECEITSSNLSTSNLSIPSQSDSDNDIHVMLQYALSRLNSQPQAKSFLRPADYTNGSKYIVHPMDLKMIERNVTQKKYNSTGAFLSDMKWILHNSVIYNGKRSKTTSNARTLLKNTRQEVVEMTICPECYLRSAQLISTEWFTIPCAIPHTLCWAKMKSYQPWPAKVLRIVNDQVDVRFFGEHQRAWVPLTDCFVLSKERPGSARKKSDPKLRKSLAELQVHVNRLKKLYGQFTYAPPRTVLSKTKPFKFVSIIDDSALPTYISVTSSNVRTKARKQPRSPSQITMKRRRENSDDLERSTKRKRVLDEDDLTGDMTKLQPTLNVLDIFSQPNTLFLPVIDDVEASPQRSPSPTDNKFQIRALLRRYVSCRSSVDECITDEVRLTVNALLDAVEVMEVKSEITLVRQSSTKRPQKSNSHQRKTLNVEPGLISSRSLDQSRSPVTSLRPLSVTFPRVDISECISPKSNDDGRTRKEERRPSIEILDVKSEGLVCKQHQTACLSPLTSPFLPVPPLLNIPVTTLPPNIYTSSSSSSDSATRQLTCQPSEEASGSTVSPACLLSNVAPVCNLSSNRTSISSSQLAHDQDHISNEMQMILNNFNTQFQQLMVNLNNQIQSSLERTRLKYEKDLEELHRSYRLSLSDLHNLATEQIQEIHKTLELQYWKRLSEMRHRFDTKLSYH